MTPVKFFLDVIVGFFALPLLTWFTVISSPRSWLATDQSPPRSLITWWRVGWRRVDFLVATLLVARWPDCWHVVHLFFGLADSTVVFLVWFWVRSLLMPQIGLGKMYFSKRNYSEFLHLFCRENMAKGGGICVANHTTPLDVLILMCDRCYSLVSHYFLSHGK